MLDFSVPCGAKRRMRLPDRLSILEPLRLLLDQLRGDDELLRLPQDPQLRNAWLNCNSFATGLPPCGTKEQVPTLHDQNSQKYRLSSEQTPSLQADHMPSGVMDPLRDEPSVSKISPKLLL
jgi:hypothetical protein